MQIMMSSKTVELTDRLKAFVDGKLARLKKYPSLGIQQIEVVVDRVKRNGRTTSDAAIEVIAQIKGRRFAFKETAANVYQAFYRVYEKAEKKLRRELRGRKERE